MVLNESLALFALEVDWLPVIADVGKEEPTEVVEVVCSIPVVVVSRRDCFIW
jgi:hypothetical protein